MSAAAAWSEGVMSALVAYSPSQPRVESGPTAGQWVADGSENSAAGDDAEAKALYAQMLGPPPMSPDQQKAFLAGLNPDQLKRVSAFAALGKATKGPIADIRNSAGEAMKARGMDPGTVGLKSKGEGKKGKKAGSGKGKSSGGGGKSGGGSKGGSGKKSGGGKSGGSSGGSKSSGSSKKKTSSSTKTPASSGSSSSKTKTPKPPPPPPAPPTVKPVRPPAGPPPVTQPVARPVARPGQRPSGRRSP